MQEKQPSSVLTGFPQPLRDIGDPESIKPCKPEFSFDFQRSRHAYINAIGDLVNDQIPFMAKIWPYLGAYTNDSYAWYGDQAHELDPDLEFVGTAHYTIMKSLCYVVRNKDYVQMGDVDQKYKNVIFHYALIVDCIKQIFFHLLNFKRKLNLELNEPVKKLTKKGFLEKAEKWYNEQYEKNYNRFIEEGGLVLWTPHTTDKFIKTFKTGKNLSKFYKFKQNYIEPLRNTFIHNPTIDIVRWRKAEDANWQSRVVKPEKIRDNKIIQDIAKLDPDSLIDPKKLMDEMFELAIDMLSEVWEIVFVQVKNVNTHLNFHKICHRQTNIR